MKFPSLFTKAPSHKRFNFQPRHYDPFEEEKKERELRIRKEISEKSVEVADDSYGSRIAGSFRQAKKTAGRQADPSASLLRIIILLFLSVWLIAYLQFGTVAIYSLILFVPVYLYLKFRNR